MALTNPSTTTTNLRPIAIFSSYMLLAVILAAVNLRTIIIKHKSRRPSTSTAIPPSRILIFSVLAAASLATTWFYMFQFFAWSYRTWVYKSYVRMASAYLRGPGVLDLGDWRRDTKLFEQAWGSACESPQRYWWTQQIFLFTTIWSLFVGVEGMYFHLLELCFTSVMVLDEMLTQSTYVGRRRNIPHLWTFMLLGQIVAISFASNMFFIAVLCSSPSVLASRKPNGAARSDRLSECILWLALFITLSCVYLVPKSIGTSSFLLVLALPHILLFIPLYLRETSGSRLWFSVQTLVILCAVALQAKATQDVLTTSMGIEDLLRVLYEHPAVSSVGWDVIFCWISFGAWMVCGG
jgi:hypothetical protein